MLHEALPVGADPPHLALVLNLSDTAASRYAAIAQNLLDHQIERPPRANESPADSGPVFAHTFTDSCGHWLLWI
ncbi:hypothetical protein ACFWBV_12805 [Streptomyces sp. NPDC060030]|uniref:hypothetical protein n=1 Tax=Streptomyces sp. NPDC060030 TaxID=3347042 RepID=UPI0036CD95C2